MAMLNRQNILTSSDAHTQNLFKGQTDRLAGERAQECFYSSVSKDTVPECLGQPERAQRTPREREVPALPLCLVPTVTILGGPPQGYSAR